MATWRVLSRGTVGTPGVDLLLPTQVAARAQAAIERARPGIVAVSVHFCPHAAGEESPTWFDCKEDPRAEYEEM